MERRPQRLRSALGAVLGLAAVAAAVGTTHAAFSDVASSSGSSFAAGTVSLADNDAGGVLLNLTSAQANASDTGCIRVSYSGSLPATVRQYGTVSGALASRATLKITRGTDSAPSFRSCASFTPDARDYVGAGAGVVYSGLLSALPTSSGAALADPTSDAVSQYQRDVEATPSVVSRWTLGDGVAEDEYTDTAGTTLQSHTGAAGASWTKHPSLTQDAVITADGRIRRAVGAGACYYASAVPASANYAVEAEFHAASVVSGDVVGIVGRLDTTATTFYLARYLVNSNRWELAKSVGSTGTLLATYTQTLTPGATYGVKLDMQGTAIRVLIDGVERMSVTDGSITAAGRGGIRTGISSTTAVQTDTTGIHLDEFRIVDSSALTARDSIGTNDGTVSGGVAYTAGALAGSYDRAALFDGVNDYVRVARQIEDSFSIEFWFSSTQGSGTNGQWWGNAGLVDAEVGGSGNDFGTSLRSDGRITAGAGAPDTSIVTSGAYNDGAWHHVVFTRSRATGRLALYVDGSLAGEANGPTQSLTGPASIDFGRIQSGNNYFAGKLDEVAVYSTALGPGDVAAHYASALRQESWTNGETRSYKFELQLDNSTTIEGLSASATFHWEARGT